MTKLTRHEQQLADDVVAVLGSPAGRRLVRWLLFSREACALMSIPDPPGDVRHEGRRAVGLDLHALLMGVDPKGFAIMMREYVDAWEAEARQAKEEQQDA